MTVVEDVLMVNLHYTSFFHLRRTLYIGVTSDLPDLSILQVAEVLKNTYHYTTTVISILHNYYTVSKFQKMYVFIFTCLDYTSEQETILKLYIYFYICMFLIVSLHFYILVCTNKTKWIHPKCFV